MTSARLVVVSIGVLASLIGCGKKSEPPGAVAEPQAAPAVEPSPAKPSAHSEGVTDSEIVLGQAAVFTGPSAGLGVEVWRGAMAAFSAANDAGGVHGRKVRLVLADDGYDAEKAAPTVLSLIQKNVFALFAGVGTPTIVKALPVVLQYHKTEGLFYFSNFTGAMPQRKPPNFEAVFNVRASYQQETKAMVDAFVAMGRKKIGAYLQDDAYGSDGLEGVKKALESQGLTLTVETRYPRGQKYEVSVDAQVKLLKDAGVDAIVAVGSYAACGALVRDVRKLGWSVPIHNVSFVGPNQMLALLSKEAGGKYVTNLINTQVVPHYDDVTLPLVVEYRAAMDKYKPTLPAEFSNGGYQPSSAYSFGSLEGFLNAKAFLAILEKNGPELTRKSFFNTAEAMGVFDLGLGAPLEFSTTRHQALDKVWFTYATAEGWKATTDPARELKGR